MSDDCLGDESRGSSQQRGQAQGQRRTPETPLSM
jgi:hypothetical protein